MLVAIAAAATYMFFLRQKRNKGRKRQSAIDENVAMSFVPPPALDTQFAGRAYGPRISPIPNSPSSPAAPHTRAPTRAPFQHPNHTSPRDPEETRVWAEWLIKTAPKPSKLVIQTNMGRGPDLSPNSPWLESGPSALPQSGGSRITNVGCEDARSPIELELAHDPGFDQAESRIRATSGPLSGPSAMPVSPPMRSRTSLHPPPRIISIKRKPITHPDPVSRPRTVSNPTISDPTPTSSQPASPRSPGSNSSSSRAPSLPYLDFNVPTSPDELFITPIMALGPIPELSSPLRSNPVSPYNPTSTGLREEDVPVLLARERVELLREERERLERIHELKRMEEQAKKDLIQAQRSSLESKRRSEDAQRKSSGGRAWG